MKNEDFETDIKDLIKINNSQNFSQIQSLFNRIFKKYFTENIYWIS